MNMTLLLLEWIYLDNIEAKPLIIIDQVFSCEDAAQKVLMYVCPCVCVSVVNLKI